MQDEFDSVTSKTPALSRRLPRGLIAWLIACVIAGLPGSFAMAQQIPFLDSHRARVAEIAGMLPTAPAGVGPPCSERTAWREMPGRKAVISRANRTISRPLPEWRDKDYLAFRRDGDNITGKRMMLALQGELTVLVDAECFLWDGRYLPRISQILNRLAFQKSWVVPQNDRSLEVFHGEKQAVDLLTAGIASKMADALYRLGDRLPGDVRRQAVAAIERRAVAPVVRALRGEGPLPWWMTSPSNWNAVCLSGIARAALSVLPDIETRALVTAAAEYYSDHYLASFSEDGYAFEGIGYWQYGFVNYARLRDQLFASTRGRIDLFEKPAAREAALFPFRFAMGPKLYASFGDAHFMEAPHGRALEYVRYVFGLDTEKSASGFPAARGIPPRVSGDHSSRPAPRPARTGATSYFPAVGILVVRPSKPGDLALTVKAGGNQRHSHNDVGSFAIGLDGTQPLGDPGGPAHYDGQSFGPKRYKRPIESSFGHPVPIIDGQYQIDATTVSPEVLARSSGPDLEAITIDMTEAYDVPGLDAFYRTIEYYREGRGRIVIRDRFKLSRPLRIVESFPTHGTWARRMPREVDFTLDGTTAVLTFGHGEPVEVRSDTVSQNGTAFEVLRAGFDLDGETVVEMSIQPATAPVRHE